MIWFLIQKIGFFIFLFLTIKYVIQKKHFSLLILYFWGLVFANCFQFFVTIWFPTKIVSLGMLLVIFKFKYVKSEQSRILKFIIRLVVLLLILSNLIALFFPGDLNPQISQIKRLVLQNYTYLTSSILLLYGSIIKLKDLNILYQKYCFIIEVAIFLGLVHYIFNILGIPFAPILRVGSYNEVSDIVANYNGSIVNRVYAFSGEPKNLGFTIAPYLIMSFFMFFKRKYRVHFNYHLILLLLGFFVLFNTFSSSALIAFVLTLFTVILVYKIKLNFNIIGLIIIFSSIFTFIFLISKSNETTINNKNFIEAFYDRTFGRATEELNEDRQETIIWNTFKNEEIKYLVFGYGPGQYIFHVKGQVKDKKLIPVQSGLIRTMVDFGFLGVILLVYYGFLIIKYLILSNKYNDYKASVFLMGAVLSYVGSFMYGNITNSFMFFMIGIFLLQRNLKSREKNI